MESDRMYPIVAKRVDGSGDPIKLKFDGYIKGEDEKLHSANLVLFDPEANRNLMEEDLDGFFSYVIEEGKVYFVTAISLDVPTIIDSVAIVDVIEIQNPEIRLSIDELVIFYDYDASGLTRKQKNGLKELIDPNTVGKLTKVEIVSYADSRGSDRYNDKLCRYRNTVVVTHLLHSGVDKKIIFTEIGGELPDICSNCVAADYDSHRKTIVKLYFQQK